MGRHQEGWKLPGECNARPEPTSTEKWGGKRRARCQEEVGLGCGQLGTGSGALTAGGGAWKAWTAEGLGRGRWAAPVMLHVWEPPTPRAPQPESAARALQLGVRPQPQQVCSWPALRSWFPFILPLLPFL